MYKINLSRLVVFVLFTISMSAMELDFSRLKAIDAWNDACHQYDKEASIDTNVLIGMPTKEIVEYLKQKEMAYDIENKYFSAMKNMAVQKLADGSLYLSDVCGKGKIGETIFNQIVCNYDHLVGIKEFGDIVIDKIHNVWKLNADYHEKILQEYLWQRWLNKRAYLTSVKYLDTLIFGYENKKKCVINSEINKKMQLSWFLKLFNISRVHNIVQINFLQSYPKVKQYISGICVDLMLEADSYKVCLYTLIKDMIEPGQHYDKWLVDYFLTHPQHSAYTLATLNGNSGKAIVFSMEAILKGKEEIDWSKYRHLNILQTYFLQKTKIPLPSSLIIKNRTLNTFEVWNAYPLAWKYISMDFNNERPSLQKLAFDVVHKTQKSSRIAGYQIVEGKLYRVLDLDGKDFFILPENIERDRRIIAQKDMTYCAMYDLYKRLNTLLKDVDYIIS